MKLVTKDVIISLSNQLSVFKKLGEYIFLKCYAFLYHKKLLSFCYDLHMVLFWSKS